MGKTWSEQVLTGGVRMRWRWRWSGEEPEVVPGLAAGEVGMSRKW
jgi:hypothetical protein